MSLLMKIRNPSLRKIFSRNKKNLSHIGIWQAAILGIQNIKKTSLLMQSQAKRSVLLLISERELHLVPVCLFLRRRKNPFKKIVSPDNGRKELLYLLFLFIQFLFIRNLLIKATPTAFPILTPIHTFSCSKKPFSCSIKSIPDR